MFAEKLQAARTAAGWSQPQLAERSGINVASIRNLEQGRRQPSWEMVQKLVGALGVPYESLAEEAVKSAVKAKKKK